MTVPAKEERRLMTALEERHRESLAANSELTRPHYILLPGGYRKLVDAAAAADAECDAIRVRLTALRKANGWLGTRRP
jgi:hypothetical protein